MSSKAVVDLDEGYSNIDSKLSAFETYNNYKKRTEKFLEDKTKKLQDSYNVSVTKFNETAAEIEKKVKKKIQNTFQKLVKLISKIKGAGSDTFKFIISLLKKAVKYLKQKMATLVPEIMMKSLGCDLNQGYNSGTFYIRVSSIDLFEILILEPSTPVGKLMFEKSTWNDSSVPRSTNRGLYDLFTTSGPFTYRGFSSRDLFTIKFVQTYNGDGNGWYEITIPPNSSGLYAVKFLEDYYKTISFFELQQLITNILESIFGLLSIKAGFTGKKIDDTTKFGLIVQRIMGLCFDEEQEISVSGQAKTPELDDVNDSFYDFIGTDLEIVETRTNEVMKRVVTFETCDNVELPVDADEMIDVISGTTLNDNTLDGFEECLDSIIVSLANNQNWSLQFPLPQISVTLDTQFIEKIPIAFISTVLSPKVILPFYIMVKSLGIAIDDNLNGIYDFTKRFKKFMKLFVSRIASEFVRILYEEIKKNIQQIVFLVIRRILKDESGQITRMISQLIYVAKIVVSIIKDYRQCKSIVDAILQLFSLLPKVQGIPKQLLPLSKFLPGYSPNRAFINTIEEMQKLGLPTGDGPDGSPNTYLDAVFAQLKGNDEEQKLNGKIDGVVILPPPTGMVEIYGKAI